MKKILAVFLAALMAFSFCAFGASAEILDDSVGGTGTFDEIKADAVELGGVILLFNFGSGAVGTFDLQGMGRWKRIVGPEFQGYYALYGSITHPGNQVKLPTIKDVDEGFSGNWYCSSSTMAAGKEYQTGITFAAGGAYTIPKEAAAGEYIIFNAQLTERTQTPTINKIFAIFVKIIETLLGGDLANTFKGLLADLGIDL